jgi:hypothetical protein
MISFREALALTENCRRYLLLGNGFSISLFPKCFTYASLFREAKDQGLFAQTPELEEAFDLLQTIDFEFVMESLKAAGLLGALYDYDGSKMSEHADLLKEVLIQAIAGRHPERPSEVNEAQYSACRIFLRHFIGVNRESRYRGKIFTLNYDLLLYWTVLHDEIDWDGQNVVQRHNPDLLHDDGFRAPEDNWDAEYVAWEQFSASHGQSVTFLHGALHLYERGPELAKLCWERAGNKPLMDQIRAALDADKYPLFVSEGTTDFKLARINRSAYLSKALRSFATCCTTKSATLFIVGHSLADNDDHVLKRIRNGKIGQVFISMFGDPESDANKRMRIKAESWAEARRDYAPLDVDFIDASTLQIWGP